MDRRRANLIDRVALALFGALSGYVLWRLQDAYAADGARAALAGLSGGVVFAGAALGMTGPLPLRRAVLLALPPGALGVALIWWASFRFDSARDFAASLHPFGALALIAVISAPFLIAFGVDHRRWRAYPVLFREAWSIVVRLTAAGLFTGIFWLCYRLADQLLGLVDITALETLRQLDGFVPALSGFVFGLALAVLDELAAGSSPALLVRLLRLLILPAAAVIAVFLGQLVLRGPGGLFSGLSAATLLIGFVAAAVTLVSAAVEGRDQRSAKGLPMRAMARFLALSVLPLAVGAGWALAERITQYGWSPARIAAAAVIAAGVGYGVGYLAAVLTGRGFNGWIRRANKAMALLLLLGAVLWLTPLIDAERISANSQVTRFADGRMPADSVDLDALGNAWGRAGQAALVTLRGMTDATGHAALMARLEQPAAARSPAVSGAARRDLLLATQAPEAGAVLAALSPAEAADADAACARRLSGGVPGCALVLADFAPDWPGPEAMLLLSQADRPGLRVLAFRATPDGSYRAMTAPLALGQPLYAVDAATVIAAARAGDIVPVVPSVRALKIGDMELIPRP